MKHLSRAFILIVGMLILHHSCEKPDPTTLIPKITTSEVSEITVHSAQSGGVIAIESDSSDIIARGVCWNTAPNPTIEHFKTNDGKGIGEFNSALTELAVNTAYYVRSYATNSGGTYYGNEESFITNYTYGEVTNPTTGRIWIDRNVGALQVATSSTDALSYGDLYQWGRAADGHEKRTSTTTNVLSSNDNPGHGNFILTNNTPKDWRSPQNDYLWQGVNGINNPCPAGYRVPTSAEWTTEVASWSSKNSNGAFASPLKLPMAGYRDGSSGSVGGVGTYGSYWSSSIGSTASQSLNVNVNSASLYSYIRSLGYSVRCIKD